MLNGVCRSEVPARICCVRCSPERMLSSTGRPRRVTSSRNNSWLRFRSTNSLIDMRHTLLKGPVVIYAFKTHCADRGSFKMLCSRWYGCSTSTKCLVFWPAMCAASIAPADALVSESMTKNRTRAFSLARCSSSIRSGVQSETCCAKRMGKFVKMSYSAK